MLEEGGLDEEEAFAAAAALADLGVKTPADLADVDEKYARQAADAAGLKPIRADKLVKVVKSRAASPKERAPSAVAAHLIDDFKMNAKVSPQHSASVLVSYVIFVLVASLSFKLLRASLKVAAQVAQHVADKYEIEQVEDLWRITSAREVFIVEALKLMEVSADKLKRAVQAAQVSIFREHVDCHMVLLMSSLVSQDKRMPPPPPDSKHVPSNNA